MSPAPGPYEPVQHHWFYNQPVDSKDSWLPFSREDSQRLEEAHQRAEEGEEGEVLVSTEGRRYDVRLRERRRCAVYWEQPPTEVRRCAWFHKSNKELTHTPYPEDHSRILEEAYMIAVTLNNWKRQVELPTGETVIFHSHKLITQHPPTKERDVPSPTERTQPRTLQRGVENSLVTIPDGEPDTVDHLVFMVHGIGPACDLHLRGIVQCVNDFRSASLSLLSSHFKQDPAGIHRARVEFLPIDWHSVLHSDTTGVDKDIQRITLPSISRLRQFSNDTILDLFFYNSPTYCQTIVDTVASEINRQHELFLTRHPDFTGGVSVVGHSLGSLILFDILTNQRTSPDEEDMPATEPDAADVPVDPACESLEEAMRSRGLEDHLSVLQQEQLDLESLTLCSESDLKDLGIPLGPRKKILSFVRKRKQLNAGARHHVREFGLLSQDPSTTSAVDYQHFDVGIGQVSVSYPQLAFHPQAFFALGSPLGMFLTVRGLKRIDPAYSLPTCKSFYNIYHPFDPVAYRIEPMLLPPGLDLPPVQIPHHMGRKRMHLELREGLTRVSSDVMGSLRTVWQALAQTPGPSAVLAAEGQDAEGFPAMGEAERRNFKVGMLNGGRRFDYVLQEAPLESFNEYLFAIQSHLCYWESEDTVLLLLKEIYRPKPHVNIPQL